MSLLEVVAVIMVIAVATAMFAGDARLPWLRSAARLLSGSTGLSLPNARFLSYGVIAGVLYGGAGVYWLIIAPGRTKLGGLALLVLGVWRVVDGLRTSRWDSKDPAGGHPKDTKQIQPDLAPRHQVAIALSQALGEEELRSGNLVVETTDGRLLRGSTIIWGWEPDALIVDQDSDAEPTLVPFRELKAISAKGLHPIRVALTAALLVFAGTIVGGYLAARSSQFEPRDGRFLGFLAGAFLSPVVIWLLQDTPWLTRYRVVYPKADVCAKPVRHP